MARYSFLTAWMLDAPLESVWEAIHSIERWPEWWRGVEGVVELERGDGDGIGAVHEHRWRSVIPYPVRFRTRITRIEPMHLIEADAEGELAGRGRWQFFAGRETVVTYEWDVRTTRRWMNLTGPLAGPVFRWNHHVVMHQGGVGLAGLLGARLIAVT